MIKDTIERTFHLGQRLPKAIVHICEYLDIHGYPISGCFELSDFGMSDLRLWFKKHPDCVDRFMPFGRGACGDVYAIWLVDDLDPEEAPIVMFGSEGQLTVLALNAREFCMLLCLGYTELGLEDHTEVGEDYDETEPFRCFVQKIYNFQLPETAEETIRRANLSYPGFKEWVENHSW